MKRVLATLIMCSVLLMVAVGSVMAGNPAYSIIEYTGGVVPATVDGVWTTADEWTDALLVQVSENFTFLYNMDMNSYSCQFCVEIFNDDTDDAEDYWQFCCDDSNTGGSAPAAGDYRIDIMGHTDLVFYEGDGSGWTEITPDSGEITWANAISDSPLESTPHWILEFSFVKTVRMATNAPPTGLRVAVYDASNSEAGVQAWAPDSDVDVPDEWGLIENYSTDSIPEGLTFLVMGVLSSVSLLVGSKYLLKRSKKQKE